MHSTVDNVAQKSPEIHRPCASAAVARAGACCVCHTERAQIRVYVCTYPRISSSRFLRVFSLILTRSACRPTGNSKPLWLRTTANAANRRRWMRAVRLGPARPGPARRVAPPGVLRIARWAVGGQAIRAELSGLLVLTSSALSATKRPWARRGGGAVGSVRCGRNAKALASPASASRAAISLCCCRACCSAARAP